MKMLRYVLIAGWFGLALTASALSIFDIEYPIAELGGCADKNECKAYCNEPANEQACVEFAEKFGVVTKRDAGVVREVRQEGGPGGCTDQQACEAHCENPANENECIDFSVQHGFMSQAEAEKIRRPGPGGCRGRSCQTYCEDPSHEDECFEYAEKNGFIPKEEVQKIRKLKNQEGPGGCKGANECRQYCDDPAHVSECVDFGEKNGFISKEEAERIKKVGLGGGPGGCRGESECRTYCDNPLHQDECLNFAEENGFMTKEEVARARRLSQTDGPGGCRGRQCEEFCNLAANAEACLVFAEQEGLMPKEELERAKKFLNAAKDGGPGGCRGAECRDFCEDSAHRDECFTFAKEKDLIRPEDERDFEVGKRLNKKLQESGGPGGCKTEGECQKYCSDPAHGEECVAFAAAHGGVSKEDAERMIRDFTEQRFERRGEFRPPEDFRQFEKDSLRRFDEFRQLEEQFRGKGFEESFGHGDSEGPRSFGGPGGCSSPADCIKYCTEHQDECFSFGGPGAPDRRPGEGGIPPGHEEFGGPRQLRSNLLRENSEEGGNSGRQNSMIRLTPDRLSGGYDMIIRDSDGIKNFALTPASGSRYSGDIGGCNREYQSDPSFSSESFPIEAIVIDCKDNEFKTTLTGGESSVPTRRMPESQGFQLPDHGNFPPPSDFRSSEIPSTIPQGSFQEQYRKEFQGQYEQQYQQEYQKQFNEQQPLEGLGAPERPLVPMEPERVRMMEPFVPPDFSPLPQPMPSPSESYSPPPTGSYMPPPSDYHPPESYTPPPSGMPPPPTSFNFRPQTAGQFLGSVIYFFFGPF